jgi:hypothetical protein
MSYPVSVWALVEDAGPSTRQVVGIDASGQWPGGADNDPGADFIRYIYQAPEVGEPADVFNPVQPRIGNQAVRTPKGGHRENRDHRVRQCRQRLGAGLQDGRP